MLNVLQVIDLGPAAGREQPGELARALSRIGPTLPRVGGSAAGETMPRSVNGGHVVWRLTFAQETDYWACVDSPEWRAEIATVLSPDQVAHVDSVAYTSPFRQPSPPGVRVGIWRCLVIAMLPAADPAALRDFERDLLLMPRYVNTIRGWSLGRAKSSRGRRAWSHVWEQEFEDLAGMEGEYMTNAIHWGLVDGWFDPECPQRIFDTCLIHAAFTISEPILAR